MIAQLTLAIAASLLAAFAGGALGKKPSHHHSKKPARHHETLSLGGGSPTVLSATTADAHGTGHIDEIKIRFSSPPAGSGLASAFRVTGYEVRGVVAHGSDVTIELIPHGGYDTGARPVVTVAPLRGRNRKISRRFVITAADGAAPVLVSATTEDRQGTGRLDAINLVFSEPVVDSPGAVQVDGYQIGGLRDYPDGDLMVLLHPGPQPDTSNLPGVVLDGAELRDAAGNRAPSGPIRLTPGAAPVMMAARDEGFWLTGEKIVTVWSAPVTESGPGGAGSFAMSTAQGSPVVGSALSQGDAPNEIAVDLPLGAETPTQIAYTGAGSEVVADLAGHPGSPSQVSLPVAQAQPQFAGTLSNPFARNQMIPFGQRSFYLQPWRSYIDTFPATRLLGAAGINFNVAQNHTADIDAGAQLLHDAGFTHARLDFAWNMMNYGNPAQIDASHLTYVTHELKQLQANGIRPLLLLQSNDGIPCPVQNVTLGLTAPAAAGATTVQLTTASVPLVKPGLTGFSQYGRDGGVLITSVNASGLATLSQPLQSAIPAGPQTAVDLAFQPFFPPYNSNGTPNANNQATMAGWLQYVAGVTQTVKSILGNDQFDVEVWNELTFGSAFLSAANYYSPAPQGSGTVTSELLQDTVNYIRNPVNGLPDVGIGDGFTNQEPFTSGASEVPGVTALDKHPYASGIQFPGQVESGIAPLDALGAVDGTNVGGVWHDTYMPSLTTLFPEYPLTGFQTETLTYDIAPFLSDIYGNVHGRGSHPPGAAAPQMWVTEVNVDTTTVNNTLSSPDGSVTSPMAPSDVAHLEAKAILRYLASYVGKGISVIDFFAAANAGNLNLIDPTFWPNARGGGGYPGLSAGGPTMVGVSRLLGSMAGAQTLSSVTPLSLNAISDYQGAFQFPGNRTAAYPPLYNRDMIGFFPFEVNAHKWVIPTYVMTLNLATLYNSAISAGDPTRADLPPEVFRFTIGGLDPRTASASATDPMTGASVPVKIVGRNGNELSVEIPLTDYPRMLTLTDG